VPLTSSTSTGIHVVVAGARPADLTAAVDSRVTVVVLGQPDRAAETLDNLLAAGRDWLWSQRLYRKALAPIKAFRTRQGADFEVVEAT